MPDDKTMSDALYHISEKPNIARFEPRPAPSPSSGAEGEMVWAIAGRLLHNYLLPRDCPRVTFYALPDSAPEDIERLMGQSAADHIVAIESGWYERACTTRLYCYELPPATFTSYKDEGAGYYTSRETVLPLSMRPIDHPLCEMLERNVELRSTPSLWPLRDAVVDSTLQFSIIRMRNARPREE